MKAVASLVLICFCVAACGGTNAVAASGSATLQVGAYAYSATLPTKPDGTAGSTSYSGTLNVTYVAADSIAGTWAVTGWQTAADLGLKNGDAYVLNGTTTAGAVVAHRISSNLGCVVKFAIGTQFGTCILAAK